MLSYLTTVVWGRRGGADPAVEGGKADVAKPLHGPEAADQNATTRNRRDKGPLEGIERDAAIKTEKLAVVRGSGHVFRDLRHKNADAEQFKSILAAEIIKALDREHLTVRSAHDRTGIAAADFSRIRHADLGRFTVNRLMSIINRLGSRVEVKVRVHRMETVTEEART